MAESHKRKAVPELVKQALRGGLKEPDLAEISAYFFQIAGGPRAIAQMLYTEFEASKVGSLTRFKILDCVLGVTKFANQRSNKGVSDLGPLSDADLEQGLIDAMDKMPEEPDHHDQEQRPTT